MGTQISPGWPDTLTSVTMRSGDGFWKIPTLLKPGMTDPASCLPTTASANVVQFMRSGPSSAATFPTIHLVPTWKTLVSSISSSPGSNRGWRLRSATTNKQRPLLPAVVHCPRISLPRPLTRVRAPCLPAFSGVLFFFFAVFMVCCPVKFPGWVFHNNCEQQHSASCAFRSK